MLRLKRPGRAQLREPEGVAPVARLEVEGVIVGDERVWDEARLNRLEDETALAGPLEDDQVEEQVVMVLGPPQLDRLAAGP